MKILNIYLSHNSVLSSLVVLLKNYIIFIKIKRKLIRKLYSVDKD